MEDVLMFLCGILFLVLFSFLMFLFTVFMISLFKKNVFPNFEPKISVVIPAYNEADHIRECLDSVVKADYPKGKVELIVVDDGSTDGTLGILKSYKRVKVLKQKHLGKVEALNLGAKKSSHEFIVTIDADSTVDEDFFKEIVKPFSDSTVGATTGNSKVKNKDTFLGSFQNIEYHFNNMIRHSFSTAFKNGIWFFGALACYRKSALNKVGFFKKDTLSEDIDVSLELKNMGYKIMNLASAGGTTVAPTALRELYSQRSRWWTGVLQALFKHKSMFSLRSCPSIIFLFINHLWWTFYAFLSFPVIAYQVAYWLPSNSGSFASLFGYLFRWFSLSGPIYVVYKIPDWGLSFYSFFGVMSGIISTVMILFAIKLFKDKLTFRNAFAIFFFFPYTIILNIITVISIVKFRLRKSFHFIS
ncbi:glycosyltransferase family 2 protein [Candidatus Woesearchaeota archaeon]|nr:glycosyltransferase family 2 protein [Candidatus Woesearchaeota archaeon]